MAHLEHEKPGKLHYLACGFEQFQVKDWMINGEKWVKWILMWKRKNAEAVLAVPLVLGRNVVPVRCGLVEYVQFGLGPSPVSTQRWILKVKKEELNVRDGVQPAYIWCLWRFCPTGLAPIMNRASKQELLEIMLSPSCKAEHLRSLSKFIYIGVRWTLKY